MAGHGAFCDEGYVHYRDLLGRHCRTAGVSIWAWVLMPNNVHLILTPQDTSGITGALSKVHRAYAGYVHARKKRTGHFWQGRFGCVVIDEAHLQAALRYVALNPVRAGLVAHAADEERMAALRRAETIGCPLGCEAFRLELESEIGHTLKPAKGRRQP